MRAMPGMKVIAPGDPTEAKLATRSIVEASGPCYLRLGKAGEVVVHEEDPDFAIGKAILLKKGSDVSLISTGSILAEVVKASSLLKKDGVSSCLVSMHTVKPIDDAIIQEMMNCKLIVTIEEHSSVGGLGSAVSEILTKTGLIRTPMITLSAGSNIRKEIGSQDWFRRVMGLDALSIHAAVLETFKYSNTSS